MAFGSGRKEKKKAEITYLQESKNTNVGHFKISLYALPGKWTSSLTEMTPKIVRVKINILSPGKYDINVFIIRVYYKRKHASVILLKSRFTCFIFYN